MKKKGIILCSQGAQSNAQKKDREGNKLKALDM